MKAISHRTLAIGGLAVAVVFFLALHVWSNLTLTQAQVDLTEGQIYTLSNSTKRQLANLQEPITLRLFLSSKLTDANAAYGTYAARVKEMLERYATLSNGKIRLEYIDPEPFSPAEDRAVGFNLQGVPLDQSGELVYFGLAANNTTDDIDTIPFLSLQREKFLEYDLTRIIHNLANPKKKIVGLITSTAMEGDPLKQYKPWRILEVVKQFFQVKPVYEAKDFTDDIDMLMIVHPVGLDDKMLYKIDQFALKGGKILTFVDPNSEVVTRSNMAQRLPPDTGSDLPKLFKAWGIKYDPEHFVGDRLSAQRVSAGEDSRGRPIITDYVAWQTMRGDRLKSGDPVTDELEQLNIASPGWFEKTKDSQINLEPLITTSKEAMPYDTNLIRRDPKPAKLLEDFKSTNRQYIIAARVTGKIKTAFPDGPPKDKEKAASSGSGDADKKDADAKAAPPSLKESMVPINMIVVADVDMLGDSFWTRTQDFFGKPLEVPIANNNDFVTNALENLSGGEAVMGLRGRGLSRRPFDTVEAIQRDAELKFRAKEQQLVQKLQEVQKKVTALQTTAKAEGSGKAKAILTAAQTAEIEKFQKEMVSIRRELRDVQHALRRDIERLDSELKVINIGVMPMLVLVVAVILWLVRRSRMRHRHTLSHG